MKPVVILERESNAERTARPQDGSGFGQKSGGLYRKSAGSKGESRRGKKGVRKIAEIPEVSGRS